MPADLIFVNGRFTTLDRAGPDPEAVAITDGVFSAIGDRADVMRQAGPATRVVDGAALARETPARDLRGFWGALGCSCFAL